MLLRSNLKGTPIRIAVCQCCGKVINLTMGEKIFFNPIIFGSDIETCRECYEKVENSGKESSFITKEEFVSIVR